MRRVCFDHLSGSPAAPAVVEAMLPWLLQRAAGAGAVHSGGVQTRAALDEAREKAGAFIHAASPEEILFTSSGTESLNLAIKGCALANQRRGKKIVLSAIEHPAVMESAGYLESLGFIAHKVGVSSTGRIDPLEMAAAIDSETILVCAHAGHHDLGTIQDLRAIGEAAADRGVAFLVDATYAGGWMPLDAQEMHASYLALAPHRFGGPKGAAILYKQRRARLVSQIHGGAQELGWRAGTENVPGIVGAGVACDLAGRHFQEWTNHVRALQSEAWKRISESTTEVCLNGPAPGSNRLPNSLNISFKGLEGEGLALALDLKGFAITSGQACSTKTDQIPPVLAAIGASEEYAAGTVILSFGPENRIEEIDLLAHTLGPVVEKLRALSQQ